ncbi:uncharacterized protein LOC101854299 [Aplysia californica]|uniref:Uncharacterized protein LOC101854299 n=1 Tax=Aplysia californica TaxID=6500 RepID=A0ABM0K8P9_APLCA|nr:uncharacterized protein LOC101854299 [Aplysia californica]
MATAMADQHSQLEGAAYCSKERREQENRAKGHEEKKEELPRKKIVYAEDYNFPTAQDRLEDKRRLDRERIICPILPQNEETRRPREAGPLPLRFPDHADYNSREHDSHEEDAAFPEYEDEDEEREDVLNVDAFIGAFGAAIAVVAGENPQDEEYGEDPYDGYAAFIAALANMQLNSGDEGIGLEYSYMVEPEFEHEEAEDGDESDSGCPPPEYFDDDLQ